MFLFCAMPDATPTAVKMLKGGICRLANGL
jgi:hypothetical protein